MVLVDTRVNPEHTRAAYFSTSSGERERESRSVGWLVVTSSSLLQLINFSWEQGG